MTQQAGRPVPQAPHGFSGGQGRGQDRNRPRSAPSAGRGRGTLLGLRPGQIVAAQLAIGGAAAAAIKGMAWLAIAAPFCLILFVLAFGRLRRRWLYQWISQWRHYFGRKHSCPAGYDNEALVELIRPDLMIESFEIDDIPAGLLEDTAGMTAVLEIGETTGLLAELEQPVPALGALLPAAGPGQPTVRMQLLLSGVAAPTARTASTSAATSYRQLTEGRVLAQQRSMLAVHVRRVGGFAEDDLRRALTSAIRRVRRRLDRVSLSCRVLTADEAVQAIADLTNHDPGYPVRESWSAIEAGGLHQVCFRLTKWPDPRAELGRMLLPRLLTLPGAGTTVSLATERSDRDNDEVRAELTVRLAAPSTTVLGAAVDGLRKLLSGAGAKARRLDGAQMDGLAATLPLGGAAGGIGGVLAGTFTAGRDDLGTGVSEIPLTEQALSVIDQPVGGAGMVLGVNRRGEPVIVRMFRPEPTRAVLIGGLRCAELIVLRALAIGAQVIVQSGRPYAWEPFLRGVGDQVVRVVPPGRIVEPPPATASQPQLLIVDVGPVGATGVTVVESAWRATLLVRDELTQQDLDVLARADLAMLQPLAPHEAYLASAALGLGDSGSWLTRIRPDMIGVVVSRRTLRWALLSNTPLENQLIGVPTR